MGAGTDSVTTTLTRGRKVFNQIGFKALLAWHYLILFTPLLVRESETEMPDFIFIRQLTLYLTLALTFLILTVWGKVLLRIRTPRSSALLHGIVGIFSMVATFAAIATAGEASFSIPVQLIAIGLLAVSEALSMYLWIHYHLESKEGRERRGLAVDMIGGVLIGFLALSLLPPFSSIAVVILPGIAAVSLMAIWAPGRLPRQTPTAEVPDEVKRDLRLRFFRNLIPTVIFALVFGLMLGGLLQCEVIFFMAPNSVVLLGIIVAGLVIYLIKETPDSLMDVDAMHRIALILLVLGVLGLSFLETINQASLSEAALLAGFNLFDFSALVLSINMTRQLGFFNAHYIAGGRALVYLGFAVGLASGFLGSFIIAPNTPDALLYIISGIAIVMLLMTLVMPLDLKLGSKPLVAVGADGATNVAIARTDTVQDRVAREADSQTDQQTTMPWRRVCTEVAQNYQLSKREIEVFLLLAKGRNAEYIQGELFISLHTAKTHIANIYHKLEVHSLQEMLDLIESFKTR